MKLQLHSAGAASRLAALLLVQILPVDVSLIDAVECLPQLTTSAGGDDVAAGTLEKRELLRTGVERDEIDLHRSVASAPDVAGHLVGAAAARVVAIRHHQDVLAEHAGAIQIGPGFTHRLPDSGATAGPRQRRQRPVDRLAIVRLDRMQRPDAARKTVETDLDRKVRTPGDERVGGIQHGRERVTGDHVLRPRIARRLVAHRSGRVHENRHRGADPFVDLGLIRRRRVLVAVGASGGRRVAPGIGLARQQAWKKNSGQHPRPVRHVYGKCIKVPIRAVCVLRPARRAVPW